MDDNKRTVITRWRLSNHRLNIEVLRYHRPKVERKDRVCVLCGVLDDESHAIFVCGKFDSIRGSYVELLTRLDTVDKFLNPSFIDKNRVASFLIELEKILS